MEPLDGFEQWKELLRKDCERLKKMREYNAIGDIVLRLLWKIGLEPSVSAIEGT